VITGLLSRLGAGDRPVSVRHLKPRTVARLRGQRETIVVDPHGKPSRGVFLSLVKIGVWLLEEWNFTLFQEQRASILICDRYYHDLLVDPVRFRFGAPLWTARLVGKLMPEPALWILLNAPAEILQERKQEVSPEETARQCCAYLEFIRSRKNYAIVDASQPLEKAIADAEEAIREVLIRREGARG